MRPITRRAIAADLAPQRARASTSAHAAINRARITIIIPIQHSRITARAAHADLTADLFPRDAPRHYP